jgi:NitT/TauT family transport system ATP-binding protein
MADTTATDGLHRNSANKPTRPPLKNHSSDIPTASSSERRERIRLQSVSKAFRTQGGSERTVLRDISSSFADGEFVTIIGPSGGGKTTLLNLIAGLLQPSAGEILLDDRTIKGPGRDRGMVFQQDAILLWRTVRRNVEYGLELRGTPARERREIAQHYIDMVGLTEFADFYPKELSGGMKKRCQIAAVLANKPEVLLMDEPFGPLDYATKILLQAKLQEIWRAEPKLTFFVTHDLEEALFLGTRIIAVAEGKIARDLSVSWPWPRTDALRLAPEFQEQKSELWRFLEPGGGGPG